jgi:hypothetical protein
VATNSSLKKSSVSYNEVTELPGRHFSGLDLLTSGMQPLHSQFEFSVYFACYTKVTEIHSDNLCSRRADLRHSATDFAVHEDEGFHVHVTTVTELHRLTPQALKC